MGELTVNGRDGTKFADRIASTKALPNDCGCLIWMLPKRGVLCHGNASEIRVGWNHT